MPAAVSTPTTHAARLRRSHPRPVIRPIRWICSSPSTGAEVGVRWNAGRFSTTATAFWLHLDSELVYVGDAGETEATSASERFGGELLFTWRPIDRIDIDLSAAATHARLIDAPGADRIPNALEYVFTGRHLRAPHG